MSRTLFRSRLQQVGFFAATICAVALSGCQGVPARPNATAGGLLGGATGGVIGSAIGAHEGKTKEGALIGAIAGGLAGSAIGNQTDQANLQRQRFINRQQEIAFQSAVSMDQVIQMTTSGLSDELIINQMQAKGVACAPTTNDLINLKANGVSDVVIGQIQAMGGHQLGHQVGHMQVVQPMIEHYPRRPPVFHQPRPVYRGPRRRGFEINF